MRVDAIDAASRYYLEQIGLSGYFSANAVDDNSNIRGTNETGSGYYTSTDLQGMLDKLQISQNKFYLIRLMERGDILTLISLLDKDKLVQAMNLFPKSKLLHFIHHMPKELILKMLLWVIPLRTFLQLFPTEVIFNILRSKRLEVSDMVRGFENVPIEMLQKLLQEITGQNVDKLKPRELRAMLFQINKDQILEGMKKMSQKELTEYIFQQVRKDPELLMQIPRGELLKAVSNFPKSTLVELFRMMPESMLMEYMTQLPENLLAMAAAQIDDKAFGTFMMSMYPDLLAELASAA